MPGVVTEPRRIHSASWTESNRHEQVPRRGFLLSAALGDATLSCRAFNNIGSTPKYQGRLGILAICNVGAQVYCEQKGHLASIFVALEFC